MEGFVLIQTHRSQGRADGTFSRSEDRTRDEHLDMLEDALGKSGARGAKTRIIMVGRVRIWFTSFDGSVTSVPYPFFLKMAKVQLRNRLKSPEGATNVAPKGTEAATFRHVWAPIYRPNPHSERRSNPFSDSFVGCILGSTRSLRPTRKRFWPMAAGLCCPSERALAGVFHELAAEVAH